jgi:hypothetical protein
MIQTIVSPPSTHIDVAGICLSLVCAVHCLTVPFLVTVLPLADAGVLLGGSLEVLFIAASVALAAGSLCWGFRRHRRWRVFIVLGTALTMIAVGRFLASGALQDGVRRCRSGGPCCRTPPESLSESDLRGV